MIRGTATYACRLNFVATNLTDVTLLGEAFGAIRPRIPFHCILHKNICRGSVESYKNGPCPLPAFRKYTKGD